MTSDTAVKLIPWDPESEQHIVFLAEQRRQCGWNLDKPAGQWRDQQREGSKCIYWIVLSPDDPNHEEKLRLHLSIQAEQASQQLSDTATTILATPREATGESFHPVGHISLDVTNPDARHLELDLPFEHVYWIKTFYVSHALQGKGVGRAAMDLAEAMATSEPLCATTLALDTAVREDVLRSYESGAQAGTPPQVSNEHWYLRRGYRVIKQVSNFYLMPNGKHWDGRTVFMRRDLV